MNYKRLLRPVLASCLVLLAFACSKDDGVDNRDNDYGYVQFKLYKAASYGQESAGAVAATRADELSYLAEATKINVRLRAEDESVIAQTLTITADSADPEYGLRSEKLQLLSGTYEIINFQLYDKNDDDLYTGFAMEGSTSFTVVEGGLVMQDLTVDVTPRGKVSITLVKVGIDKTPQSRAEYTLDEVRNGNVTVYNLDTRQLFPFEKLPFSFSIHFDENNAADGTPGYQTSDLRCDSLLSLPAGNYRIEAYELYSRYANTAPLVTRRYSAANPIPGDFTVTDNQTTQVEVGVTIDTEAAYIQDYKALKEIWEALNGESWYYAGLLYAKGCNWNFNKDIDLWGDQPGVQLHGNGRIASIDFSDFGVRGEIPAAIGQLSELTELYLGTHNDSNLYDFVPDPSIDRTLSISTRRTQRMELNKQYLAALHQAPQMSEPCARALREHNIEVPETRLYAQGYKENEVINTLGHAIERKEVTAGKICNGITGIDEALGNLTKLELLYIANGEIEKLPDVFDKLTSLTDLEIYNCPKMKEFPVEITKAPELIAVNLSNNPQWDAQTVHDGLQQLATSPSRKSIQLLYCTDGNLEELPEEFNNLEKLGLLDLVNNKISKLYPLGPNVAPVQLYLDHNEIEEFPTDDAGVYCKMMDMENFSASYNKLKKFPNIFYSNGFTISSINLAMNEIDEVEPGFKGIRVTTLTLTGNKFQKFPKQLINSDGNRNRPLYDSSIAYIVFRANDLQGFEEGAFTGTNSQDLVSLDLSYNHLTKFPKEFSAVNMPYLYGIDVSNNAFSKFPYEPFDAYTLTVYAVRAQRDSDGHRCLREWPTGVYLHTGLRGLYLGSNDLRAINDTISYLIYYLDISDNPNITFDASSICASWKAGLYYLIYDKTQNILNCEEMLQ